MTTITVIEFSIYSEWGTTYETQKVQGRTPPKSNIPAKAFGYRFFDWDGNYKGNFSPMTYWANAVYTVNNAPEQFKRVMLKNGWRKLIQTEFGTYIPVSEMDEIIIR